MKPNKLKSSIEIKKKIKKTNVKKNNEKNSNEKMTNPMTVENVSKINYLTPMHKYIRINQWINLSEKNCDYPYPLLTFCKHIE